MKASELAARAGLPYEGDGDVEVFRVRGLDHAGPQDLSFINDATLVKTALQRPVRVLVAPPDLDLPGKTVLRSPHPRLALTTITPLLHPRVTTPPGIDPRAVVGPDCQVDSSAIIHPLAVLEAQAVVGPRSEIMPGVFLGRGVTVGADCLIYPNVTIGWGCQIGQRVIIHAGSVIGSDGFGFVLHQGRHIKVPHVGRVVLEDDVEIGANNSIDRAVYDETRIGQGSKTDNLCHIAHNVEIGPHALLLGQTGIAGSTKAGAYLIMAGQSGITDHLHIPERVTVGTKSLLTRPGRSGEIYYGYPARPVKEWQQSVALFNTLDKLAHKVKTLWRQRPEASNKAEEE